MKSALIVGSTGIVGDAMARCLMEEGWTVAGLSRKPVAQDGVSSVVADLQEKSSLIAALKGLRPTHVFISTWSRQATEVENTRVNRAMVHNLLAALRPASTVRHVALVTGIKHYLGPFESYSKARFR